MLQNFIICVNAVIPSMIYLVVGIVLKLCHVVTEDEVKRFTHMTFVAFYPFMMFENLYGKDIGANMSWRFVTYSVGFAIIQIAVSWWIVCKVEDENYNRGAMMQSMWRSNLAIMGLPIGIYLFGKDGVTAIAVLMIFIVPLYNIVATVMLEYFRGGKTDVGKLIKGVLTNPLIIGGIAALVVSALHIRLPEIVTETIGSISSATTPIAMILLGASLKLGTINSDKSKIIMCVKFKLLISPAFAIFGAMLMGFRDVQLIAIVLMSATPTALATFAMSSSMGGNGELAGENIVISTILSCFTMPIWLFLLMNGGYF